MAKNVHLFQTLGIFLLILILRQSQLFSQIERFIPKQGGSIELWRITNNPSIRNAINYHNTDDWSPDGRYVSYVKYEPYDTIPARGNYVLSLYKGMSVYIYDLYKDKEILVGNGKDPRWANKNNWLFYVQYSPEGNKSSNKDYKLMWFDVDNNKLTLLTYGVPSLGETDSEDRWIYGYSGRTEKSEWGPGLRVPIRPGSRPEKIYNNPGYFWIPNPAHPVIQVRGRDDREQPYIATRTFCDLDGMNITIGSPQIQRCHQTWSGDGMYLVHGGTSGTLISGRRWDEPFPSNLHVLTAIHCGNPGSCGKSGRWIAGGDSYSSLQLADLRSGDGWNFLELELSDIFNSIYFDYTDGSHLQQNNAKGSADGTKIIFNSNYDLKDGPLTEVTETSSPSDMKINVKSTDGFPATGDLDIGNEIIGYTRKTSVSFEGLTRLKYNATIENITRMMAEFSQRKSDEEFIKKYTPSAFNIIKATINRTPPAIRKGQVVTSFDDRLIPENLRKNMKPPTLLSKADFPDKNLPLIWQRRADVYIAVVRLPDQPYLSKTEDGVELIPGENHWETFGYNIFKDGIKITRQPLRPGVTFDLMAPGTYTATAVEWSGLESKKNFPLKVEANTKLNVRYDKPTDFSWTSERWLVNGQEVPKEDAVNSEESVKEIIHLIDGVIHREWYNWGQITQRHDLNAEGKASRRLYYTNGKLAKREYYHQGINLTSRELFDEDGKFITESMQYTTINGKPKDIHHFWYEKGYPVRFAGSGGRHAADDGAGIYEKEGKRWVKKKAF